MAGKIYVALILILLVYVLAVSGEELLEGCMMTIEDMEDTIPTEPILPVN